MMPGQSARNSFLNMRELIQTKFFGGQEEKISSIGLCRYSKLRVTVAKNLSRFTKTNYDVVQYITRIRVRFRIWVRDARNVRFLSLFFSIHAVYYFYFNYFTLANDRQF